MNKSILLCLLVSITCSGQVVISMDSSSDNSNQESKNMINSIENIHNDIFNNESSNINNNINMNSDKKSINEHSIKENIFNPQRKINTQKKKTNKKKNDNDNKQNSILSIRAQSNNNLIQENHNTNDIKIFSSKEEICEYLSNNDALEFSVENILDASTLDKTIENDDILKTFEEWSYKYLNDNCVAFLLDQCKLQNNDNDLIDSTIKKLKEDENSNKRIIYALQYNAQYARHIIHNNIYAVLVNLVKNHKITLDTFKKLGDIKNNTRNKIISNITGQDTSFLRFLPKNYIEKIQSSLIKAHKYDETDKHANSYDLTSAVAHGDLLSNENFTKLAALIKNGYVTNPKTMDYIKIANIRRYLRIFDSVVLDPLTNNQNSIIQLFCNNDKNDNDIINNCITFLKKNIPTSKNGIIIGNESKYDIASIVLTKPKYSVFTKDIIHNKIYNIAVDHYLMIAKKFINDNQRQNKYIANKEQLQYDAIQITTQDIKNEYRKRYMQTILNILLKHEDDYKNYEIRDKRLQVKLNYILFGRYANQDFYIRSINPTEIGCFDFYEAFNRIVFKSLDSFFKRALSINLKSYIDGGYITNPYLIKLL